MSDLSMNPIVPTGSDITPDAGVDEDALTTAFENHFGPGDPAAQSPLDAALGTQFPAGAPDLQATGEPDDTSPSSPREDGEGGGGASPSTTPPATPPVADDLGGPADPTPPDGAPTIDGLVIVDDGPGSVASVDETAPETPTPPSAPLDPFSQPVDVTQLLQSYLGRDVSLNDARDLLSLLEDINSGRIILTPAEQAQLAAQQAQPQPFATPSPTQDPTRPPATHPETRTYYDEYGNPVEVPAVDPAIQARLDEMDQWRRQQEQAALEQQRIWIGQEQSAAIGDFVASAPLQLSPAEVAVLETKAARTGQFAQLLQQGIPPRAAWKKTLEDTLYTDTAYRQRLIEAEAQSRLAQQNEALERQRRAASVSAGGGTAPGAMTPVSNEPKTLAEAKDAATQDVARLLGFGQ